MNYFSCQYCGSKETIYDDKRAEYRCKMCGAVFSEGFAVSAEGNDIYAPPVKGGRGAGGATNGARHDNGLGSEIGSSRGNVPEAYKLRMIGRNRFLTAKERSLAIALNRLNVAASILGIPMNIKKDAIYIYKKAMKADLIRGRSIDGFVASSLFIACRNYNVSRSLDEMAEVTGVNRKFIARMNGIISKELNIRRVPSSPSQYVPRFATKLELPGEVEAKAIEIIYDATKQELTVGKDPVSIAAAALYMASVLLNVKKSQKAISEVSGVSDVTIRARYKELAERLDIEINV